MDTNGNHLKKLSYDRVMYINADDHYVYYVRNNENNGTGFDFFSYARNSLCRIDQNGENTKILDKDPCLYASLVGNYIYYLHYDDKDATTLYKIGIDGEGRKKVYSPYILHAARWVSIFIPAEPKVTVPSISWIPPVTV